MPLLAGVAFSHEKYAKSSIEVKDN